ncbi:MAG: hypothetical protein LC739_03025 [Actinobacteria bacterium]|nr:hypothetical protein [Actinomycetota bacterium]
MSIPEKAGAAPKPEAMRTAMADYVRTVHQAYATQARTQPPAIQGRMLLLDDRFTVVAAAVRNLHVIATRENLSAPRGQEVELSDSIDGVEWVLRFLDPVVLPALGIIDESQGARADLVRRAVGITTHLYHLIVQPGSQLTGHHAGHAGSGLANSHVAEARDFEAIRAAATGREALVDEMEGAAAAGLSRAQALLAREIAPELGSFTGNDPEALRKALLSAVRGENRG